MHDDISYLVGCSDGPVCAVLGMHAARLSFAAHAFLSAFSYPFARVNSQTSRSSDEEHLPQAVPGLRCRVVELAAVKMPVILPREIVTCLGWPSDAARALPRDCC